MLLACDGSNPTAQLASLNTQATYATLTALHLAIPTKELCTVHPSDCMQGHCHPPF